MTGAHVSFAAKKRPMKCGQPGVDMRRESWLWKEDVCGERYKDAEWVDEKVSRPWLDFFAGGKLKPNPSRMREWERRTQTSKVDWKW